MKNKDKKDGSAETERKARAETAVDWTAAEEASMVEVLLKHKDLGNQSDSGWKPIVWQDMVGVLARDFESKKKKTASHCKSRWQRLKSEFRIVKELRELSGFGWDEDKQMVTAPPEVWDRYCEEHPRAKPFRKKPFPLYDSLEELIGRVVATGASALHLANAPASADDLILDAEGSVPETHAMDQVGLLGGEEDNNNSSSESGNDAEMTGFGSPAIPALGKRKRDATHSSHSSSRSSSTVPKRSRPSATSSLLAMSTAVESLAASFKKSDSPERVRRNTAVKMIEEEEGLSDHAIGDAATVFMDKVKVELYLAFSNKKARRRWLQNELDKVV